MNDEKIVIVGSGISGMAAAINLCNNGVDPVIFEKNPSHGGYASSINQKGFRFEISLHFVGKVFFRVLENLGIRNDIEMIDVRDTSNIDCKKSCNLSEYSYNDKAETYKKYLIEKYPSERKGIEKIFSYGSSVEKISDDMLFGKHPLIAMLSHPGSMPFFGKYMKKTGADLLDDLFSSDEIKKEISTLAILLGTPNESLSTLPYTQLATEFYNRGAYYIAGGSQRLSDVMRSRIEKSGGKFLFNSPVTRFNIDDGIVKSIVVGKKIFDVDHVLYCCDILNLQNKFARGNQIFKVDINSLPIAYSSYVMHLGFDVDIKKDFGIDRAEYNVKTPNLSFSVAVYSNKDPSCCKKGTSTLTISVVEQKKSEELILQELELVWPGITSHIIEKLYMTPMDYEKMTWNTGGSFGGFQSTPKQTTSPVSHQTLVKNLLVAGQWTGFGAGYINSIIGGIDASTLLLKKI